MMQDIHHLQKHLLPGMLQISVQFYFKRVHALINELIFHGIHTNRSPLTPKSDYHFHGVAFHDKKQESCVYFHD